MSANKPRIVAVIGASGSGKSATVKTDLLTAAARRRLLVWDYMREYGPLVDSSVDVTAPLVEACRGKRFAVAMQPSFDGKIRARQFDLFCRLGYALGDCTLLVEELAFVTTASFAPPAWSMVSCTGRHQGMSVIGCSQRPAQIDKNFLGNCSAVRCFRLNDRNDLRVMGNVLGVAEGELRALPQLEWIERDMVTGKTRRGRVDIAKLSRTYT